MKIGKNVGGSSEWVIEDAGYVKEIKFYNAGGVWLTVDQGWLTHTENPGNEKRVAFVEIDQPKRRIKLDSAMEKSENFYMKKPSSYKFEKDGLTLYIYMKTVSPDTIKAGESDLRVSYAKQFTIPLLAVCDDATPLNAVKVIGRGMGFDIPTDFGKQVESVDQAFSLDGIPITGSDTAKLLRLYNVTRKVLVQNIVKDEATGKIITGFTDEEISKLYDEQWLHRRSHECTDGMNVFTVSGKVVGSGDVVAALQQILKGANE